MSKIFHFDLIKMFRWSQKNEFLKIKCYFNTRDLNILMS